MEPDKDGNHTRPLLERISEIENNLKLVREQVAHPLAQEKTNAKIMEEVSSLSVSLDAIEKKSKQIELELKEIQNLRKLVAENKNSLESESIKINHRIEKSNHEIKALEELKEDIFQNKKMNEVGLEGINLKIEALDTELLEIENIKKLFFENKRAVSSYILDLNKKISNVERSVTEILVVKKIIKENKKRQENEIKNIHKELRGIDREEKEIKLLTKTVSENKKLGLSKISDLSKKINATNRELKKLPSIVDIIDYNKKEMESEMVKLDSKIIEVKDSLGGIDKLREEVFLINGKREEKIEILKLGLKEIISKNKKISASEYKDLSKRIEKVVSAVSEVGALRELVLKNESLRDEEIKLIFEDLKGIDREEKMIDSLRKEFLENKKNIASEFRETSKKITSTTNSLKGMEILNKDISNNKKELTLKLEKNSDDFKKDLALNVKNLKSKIKDSARELERSSTKKVSELSNKISKFERIGSAMESSKKEVSEKISFFAEDLKLLAKEEKDIRKIKKILTENKNSFDSKIGEVNKRIVDLFGEFVKVSKFKKDTEVNYKNQKSENEAISRRLIGLESSSKEAMFKITEGKRNHDRDLSSIENKFERLRKEFAKVKELRQLILDNNKDQFFEIKKNHQATKDLIANNRKDLDVELDRTAERVANLVLENKKESALGIENISKKLGLLEKEVENARKQTLTYRQRKDVLHKEEILKGIGDFSKGINQRVDILEKESKLTNEKVYVQLDEVVELIMFWEKRLNKLETYTHSMGSKGEKKMKEISESIKTQTAQVKTMKVKQDILSQLKRTHGNKRKRK